MVITFGEWTYHNVSIHSLGIIQLQKIYGHGLRLRICHKTHFRHAVALWPWPWPWPRPWPICTSHLYTILDNVAKFHGKWIRTSGRKPYDKNLLTHKHTNGLTKGNHIICLFHKQIIIILLIKWSTELEHAKQWQLMWNNWIKHARSCLLKYLLF